jgi:hypothetical protein
MTVNALLSLTPLSLHFSSFLPTFSLPSLLPPSFSLSSFLSFYSHTIDLAVSGTDTRKDTYELIYSPLHSGSFTGKISFLSPKMGQFWYKLNLSAVPAKSTALDLLECMVGSDVSVPIHAENPLGDVALGHCVHSFYVSSFDPILL